MISKLQGLYVALAETPESDVIGCDRLSAEIRQYESIMSEHQVYKARFLAEKELEAMMED